MSMIRHVFADWADPPMDGLYMPDGAGGVRAAGMIEWSAFLIGRSRERLVLHTRWRDVSISTVFYGVDMLASFRSQAPNVYQTKIFGGYCDGFDLSTPDLKSARVAHYVMLRLVLSQNRDGQRRLRRRYILPARAKSGRV